MFFYLRVRPSLYLINSAQGRLFFFCGHAVPALGAMVKSVGISRSFFEEFHGMAQPATPAEESQTAVAALPAEHVPKPMASFEIGVPDSLPHDNKKDVPTPGSGSAREETAVAAKMTISQNNKCVGRYLHLLHRNKFLQALNYRNSQLNGEVQTLTKTVSQMAVQGRTSQTAVAASTQTKMAVLQIQGERGLRVTGAHHGAALPSCVGRTIQTAVAASTPF